MLVWIAKPPGKGSLVLSYSAQQNCYGVCSEDLSLFTPSTLEYGSYAVSERQTECSGQFIGRPQTFVELQLRFKLHFYTKKMQFEM